MLEIKGRLFDGMNKAVEFTQLDWLWGYCQKELGFIPYPGTLNIKVAERNYQLWRILCTQIKGIILESPNDEYCSARIYPGVIGNISVGAIIPSVEGYPEDVIELLAPVRLREKLQINTGDLIKIRFLNKD